MLDKGIKFQKKVDNGKFLIKKVDKCAINVFIKIFIISDRYCHHRFNNYIIILRIVGPRK